MQVYIVASSSHKEKTQGMFLSVHLTSLWKEKRFWVFEKRYINLIIIIIKADWLSNYC